MNERNELTEEFRQHLKEVAEKLQSFGKQGWDRQEFKKVLEYLDEQVEIAEDYQWKYYLASETKDEYEERTGEY